MKQAMQYGYSLALPTKPLPMSSVELRQVMRELGCRGHEQLADRIGVSRSTVSLWLAGRVKIPLPIAMLLRLLVQQP
jgi:transcriptional regulator with XRE-family HTH domain